MKCIYCDKEILESTSTYEHIIQSALGAYAKSNKIICKDCNNFFSNKDSNYLDKVLAEQYIIIRNMHEIEGDRGTKPPVIKKVFKQNDIWMDFKPGLRSVVSKTTQIEKSLTDSEEKKSIVFPDIKKAKERYKNFKKQYPDGKIEARLVL